MVRKRIVSNLHQLTVREVDSIEAPALLAALSGVRALADADRGECNARAN